MWPKFSVQWSVGATRYRIVVLNPDHRCTGVRSAELDGTAVDPRAIPLLEDGKTHDVVVELGEADTRAVSSGVAATAASGSR
jgi:cyclic beta-1,2-glucan synthetase